MHCNRLWYVVRGETMVGKELRHADMDDASSAIAPEQRTGWRQSHQLDPPISSFLITHMPLVDGATSSRSSTGRPPCDNSSLRRLYQLHPWHPSRFCHAAQLSCSEVVCATTTKRTNSLQSMSPVTPCKVSRRRVSALPGRRFESTRL